MGVGGKVPFGLDWFLLWLQNRFKYCIKELDSFNVLLVLIRSDLLPSLSGSCLLLGLCLSVFLWQVRNQKLSPIKSPQHWCWFSNIKSWAVSRRPWHPCLGLPSLCTPAASHVRRHTEEWGSYGWGSLLSFQVSMLNSLPWVLLRVVPIVKSWIIEFTPWVGDLT